LGNPEADRILQALRAAPNGLTRTEIRDLFDRNRNASEINGALTVLEERGLARRVPEATAGRPIERWIAASSATTKTT
jgi:DNA-binding IclR family transcriptional regulator